jgi:hypothetical protein
MHECATAALGGDSGAADVAATESIDSKGGDVVVVAGNEEWQPLSDFVCSVAGDTSLTARCHPQYNPPVLPAPSIGVENHHTGVHLAARTRGAFEWHSLQACRAVTEQRVQRLTSSKLVQLYVDDGITSGGRVSGDLHDILEV